MEINASNDNNHKKTPIKNDKVKSEQNFSEVNLFGQDSFDSASNDMPTIFAPKDNKPKSNFLVDDLETQGKKFENASKKPVFQMSEAEKQEMKKLNAEQARRDNYSKKLESREKMINHYSSYIDYYKIDVKNMTAEQIEKAVLDACRKEGVKVSPKQGVGATLDGNSYNYKTLPNPIENNCMFKPSEYLAIEEKRDKYRLSNKAPDEKDKTDKNFQYKSNRDTSRFEEMDKAYRKKCEMIAENKIDSRLYSVSKSAIMVETYGGFREATVFGDEQGYHGKIGANNFKIYRRANEFDAGTQYLGRIGKSDVDIEERDIHFSMYGLRHYFGKIGNDDFKMETKSKEFSAADRVICEGIYKGKSFQVEVGGDNVLDDDGDRVIRGYYGGQRVDIKKTPSSLTNNDRLKINQLPKDFDNVASFIFVTYAELEKDISENQENE